MHKLPTVYSKIEWNQLNINLFPQLLKFGVLWMLPKAILLIFVTDEEVKMMQTNPKRVMTSAICVVVDLLSCWYRPIPVYVKSLRVLDFQFGGQLKKLDFREKPKKYSYSKIMSQRGAKGQWGNNLKFFTWPKFVSSLFTRPPERVSDLPERGGASNAREK